jgi:hydroxyacylglutathione hydrolase
MFGAIGGILLSKAVQKKLFVHCASGKRASLATAFLRAEGFDAVHVDGAFSK